LLVTSRAPTIVNMGTASSSLQPHLALQDPIDPSDNLHGTPIVCASFASAEEFLLAYSDDGAAGELALVTRARPRGRAQLVVEVSFPGLPNPVFVRARVSRRRLGIVAKLHPDETKARDFLLRLARHESVDYFARAHRRYCVRLPLGWRAFGAIYMTDGIAEDLSAGGVRVATKTAAPPVGEQVALRLRTAGQDLVVTGVVRHARVRSHDSVFGVQFECRSSGEQRRLRRLLRVFAARGVVILERS
jgi:hypothetical protein